MASRWIVPVLLAIYVVEVSPGSVLHYKKKPFPDQSQDFVTKTQTISQYKHQPTTYYNYNKKCHLVVNKNDSIFYRNQVQDFSFNFANIQIEFVGNFKINQTADVLLPYQWVWTYYQSDGFFPYLKWGLDFSVLSFGLLGIKTGIPRQKELTLRFHSRENCSLTLGSLNTTYEIGQALMRLTEKYLVPMHAREFSYSYWCYTKEVPKIKDTLVYKLGIHLGFPVEFSRYNCCRTRASFYSNNRSALDLNCIDQVPQMYQTVVPPYIAALFAFAYFPILFFNCAGQSIARRLTRSRDFKILNEYCANDEGNWIFLDGKPPISFRYLIRSFCRLGDKHPVVASRLYRLLLLLLAPGIVYVHILIYWKVMPEMVAAFLEHGKPLGFISLLGGLRESMQNFAPMLGGPPCLLAVYYLAGLIFLIAPKDLNTIIQRGTDRFSQYDTLSPLFYSEGTLVDLAGVKLHTFFGYSKVAAACRAGVYTLTNYKFWVSSISLQIKRIKHLFDIIHTFSKPSNLICHIALALFIPFYILFCIAELTTCIVLYGVPVITSICILAKGYSCTLNVGFEKLKWMEFTKFSQAISFKILRVITWIFSACVFLYFIISVSTILVSTFHFLCQLIVFSFLAVIVYPSAAFGYIFFTCIILFYISKQMEHFGDGYFELLSIAVEICSHMEEELFFARMENDVLVINKTNGSKISKLRVQNHTINLSTDQRNQIQHSHSGHQRRIYCKDDTVGIPMQLFEYLVKHFRPVHVQVFHDMLRVLLIILLVAGSVSFVIVKPFGPTAEIAEILHIIFIIAIGALPKILEIAIDKKNHATIEEIKRRKMKSLITEYWVQKDAMLNAPEDLL